MRTENTFLANIKQREIPSLYGLRGIAALTVVFYHYLYQQPYDGLFPGRYAVNLFFILSGLLITWLMLKERDKTGSIHFGQFYGRRALRLFPAFYAVWIVAVLTLHNLSGKWAAFFYVYDYYWALGWPEDLFLVTWSLGVEEKFYLLWPWVMRNVSLKRLYYVIPSVIVADQVYRGILNLMGHAHYTNFAFDTNIDSILMGCYIALLAHRGVRFPRWLGNPLIPIAAIASLYTCGETVVNYCLALLLIWAIIKQPWYLNNPVARYLGLISYSLYLSHLITRWAVWQPLFGAFHFPRWSLMIGSQIVTAIVCASILHFGIERPFLRLKDRLHPAR